jgi:carotenoid 1,2-hydratase
VTPFDPEERQVMGRTAWQVNRTIRATPHRVRTLEDTPFYARGMVEAELLGQRVLAMHETLDLPRLRSPIVKAMLPWRMPRRG